MNTWYLQITLYFLEDFFGENMEKFRFSPLNNSITKRVGMLASDADGSAISRVCRRRKRYCLKGKAPEGPSPENECERRACSLRKRPRARRLRKEHTYARTLAAPKSENTEQTHTHTHTGNRQCPRGKARRLQSPPPPPSPCFMLE